MLQILGSAQKRNGGISRRALLQTGALGLCGLAGSNAVRQAAGAEGSSDSLPGYGRAKRVLVLYIYGAWSQLETFDPKPELTKHGGKTIPNTPFASVLDSPYIKNRIELVKGDANGRIYDKLYPLQVGYGKRGESGIEVSDWLPHLSECVDDMAIVRSMWTTASNHDAQLQFHTGRNRFDGFFPTIGAWVHYGLGSLNDSLPQFIVMGNKIGDCCGGKATEGADYLGPEHDGVTLSVDPKNPLPFAIPAEGAGSAERLKAQKLLGRLNRLMQALRRDGASDGAAIQVAIRQLEQLVR